MEVVRLENNCYPHIKRLINFPEWKVYEQILEGEKQRLIEILETDENENLKKIQTQIMQINRILRKPYELVEEFEESVEGGKK